MRTSLLLFGLLASCVLTVAACEKPVVVETDDNAQVIEDKAAAEATEPTLPIEDSAAPVDDPVIPVDEPTAPAPVDDSVVPAPAAGTEPGAPAQKAPETQPR